MQKSARTHGLPKIRKDFTDSSKFRRIIDSAGTSHCLVGKYLANLLNLLTINEFFIKDSFEEISGIKDIPQDLLHNGHQFILFDVESLFTNVPIGRIVGTILKRICNDRVC